MSFNVPSDETDDNTPSSIIELGKKDKIFGADRLQPLAEVCGRPSSMPPVPEGHQVICGYDQGLGEKLFVCYDLNAMQELYDAYAMGWAIKIHWYSGEDPGFLSVLNIPLQEEPEPSSQVIDAIRRETVIDQEKIHSSREIRSEELASLNEVLPHQAVAAVEGSNGEKCYQPLDPKDPEGVDLDDYRKAEIDEIKQLLTRNALVALVGPSTSGKTHPILIGLANEEGGAYIPCFIPNRKDIHSSDRINKCIRNIEKRLREKKSSSKLVLLDEFLPLCIQSVKLVKVLIEKGYKVVVAIPGIRSNKAKIEELKKLGDQQSDFKNAPIVSISIKPLTKTQLQQALDKQMEQNPKRYEALTAAEKQKTFKAWEIIKDLSDQLPIPVFTAFNTLLYNRKSVDKILGKNSQERVEYIKKAIGKHGHGDVLMLDDITI